MNVDYRKTGNEDLLLVMECESKYPDYIGQWSLQQHADAINNPDFLHLTFFNGENEFIGYVILKGIANTHRSIELMRVAVMKTGLGYGKEIIGQIIRLSFDNLKAHRLWLDVRANNIRAQNAYQNIGFIKEGLLRETILVGNEKYESLFVMSILESEYRQREKVYE